MDPIRPGYATQIRSQVVEHKSDIPKLRLRKAGELLMAASTDCKHEASLWRASKRYIRRELHPRNVSI